MEIIFIYLLKSSLGLVLFYAMYWLFLRKETFYNANRLFLVLGLITSIILPVFPIHYTVMIEQQTPASTYRTITETFKNIPVMVESDMANNTFNWANALLYIYITGAMLFMARLISQSCVLLYLRITGSVKEVEGLSIVENEKYGLPFSFFNMIYINPKFHKQENLGEILAHEKVHIRENHWFDLLLIELLTVIFWFNPFIWFFERSIKQNHEYLADKGVLSEGHAVAKYQALLVNQLMGMQIIGVTNNLNYALNTNRLKMMTKKKSSVRRRTKFVWTLPVLAILLYAFAEPVYREKVVENTIPATIVQGTENGKELKIEGKVLMKDTGEPLPGASVVIKGTPVGTVVDRDGTFSLVDPNPKADKDGGLNTTLVVSFVGLRTVENQLGASRKNLEKNQGTISGTIKMEDDVVGIGLAEKLIPVKKEYLVTSPPPPPPPPTKDGKEAFYIIETMPNYPGGPDALNNYVYKMQQKIVAQKKVKGKAMVMFTVNAKGKVSDIKVVKSDNDEVAKGAHLIAKGIKDWKPGTQRGKAVPVKYMLPVVFK